MLPNARPTNFGDEEEALTIRKFIREPLACRIAIAFGPAFFLCPSRTVSASISLSSMVARVRPFHPPVVARGILISICGCRVLGVEICLRFHQAGGCSALVVVAPIGTAWQGGMLPNARPTNFGDEEEALTIRKFIREPLACRIAIAFGPAFFLGPSRTVSASISLSSMVARVRPFHPPVVARGIWRVFGDEICLRFDQAGG